jgi:Tfp pilus assembly PilM family ATPase/Tfp pilus assembly protein PilN
MGTDQVTIVQLSGTTKAYSVTTVIQHPLPQHADPAEQDALQRQSLRELVDSQRFRADTILATLPAHKAVLRNLSLPFKDPRRIRQTLKGVLEEHMPFEPEDVVADFQPLPPQNSGDTPLLVAAIPQEVIASHLGLLQDIGLEPTIIDLDVFALANAALLGSSHLGNNAVLIDHNPTRTLMTVLHRGMPVFARSLTRVLPPTDVSPESQANHLGKHLQHTLYACENVLRQPYDADILLLSGEDRHHLGRLAAALETELEVHAEVWQPTSEHHKPGKTQAIPEDLSQCAVAFGAAIRGLHRQAVGVNLRREHFELHRDIQELRGRLIGLGIMLVLVAGLGLFSLFLNTRFKTQRHTQLRQEIGRIFRDTLPSTRMVQPTDQMREKIRDIEERLRAFGGVTGAQLSGLQILREVSTQVPSSITVDIDTLTITTDTTDLSGTTDSYDNVVKLKDALEASSFFTTVKITNTKTDVKNKVAFKLTITTTRTPEDTP